MKGSSIVVAALILTAPQVARAQQDAGSVRLTVAEATQRALAASDRLDALSAYARAATADVRAARSARWPQLDAAASYQRRSAVPELSTVIPDRGVVTIFPNIQDNASVQLTARVPLYAGGAIAARVDAARAQEHAAGEERAAGAADVVLETTNAYWTLVTARRTQAVLADALTAFDAHLTDARNRERFGLAAHNEVLAVQVERDRADLRRLRAANAAAVAEVDLARLVGLEPGARIETTEPLEKVAPPEDVTAHEAEAGERNVPEPLVEQALERRPERARLGSQIAAAEAAVRVEHAAKLPQVHAEAGWDYANPNRQILPMTATWQDTWQAGVGVSLAVLDGGRRGAATAAAQARVEALRARLHDLERGIRLEVTRAWLDEHAEHEALAVAERNLAAARENLRVAKERHAAGVIPSSERLDAEVALLQSGLDRTQALAGVHLARARLDRALGSPAPEEAGTP